MSEREYTPAMLGLSPEDQVAIARARDGLMAGFRGPATVVVAVAVPFRELVVIGPFLDEGGRGVTLLCDSEANVVPYTPGWRWAETCSPLPYLQLIQRALEPEMRDSAVTTPAG